jgi:Na+-transporting NADH:ubiquinone oxidoreductase subunit A
VLNGQEADFQTGLDVLAKVAPTFLGVSAKQQAIALTQAKNVTVTVFDGPHPAGNVGVQINHVAPVNKGEVVWTLGAEEVIFIGRLFNNGCVDFTRTIAVAGSEVNAPAYARVKVGAQIESVLNGRLAEGKNLRIIDGNVLTGCKSSMEGFVGAHTTALTVIPEGDDVHEML